MHYYVKCLCNFLYVTWLNILTFKARLSLVLLFTVFDIYSCKWDSYHYYYSKVTLHVSADYTTAMFSLYKSCRHVFLVDFYLAFLFWLTYNHFMHKHRSFSIKAIFLSNYIGDNCNLSRSGSYLKRARGATEGSRYDKWIL